MLDFHTTQLVGQKQALIILLSGVCEEQASSKQIVTCLAFLEVFYAEMLVADSSNSFKQPLYNFAYTAFLCTDACIRGP